MRLVLLLWVTLFLAGCDRFEAFSLPVSEKIARAFPLPPEVAVAQAGLLATIAGDATEAKQVSEQIGKLTTIRALTCAGTVPIGKLDTAADIKAKLTDRECFKKQDAIIADWIGLRRVAVALRQTPLRPYAELPEKMVVQSGENVVHFSVAESANVAAARLQGAKFSIVDLSSGKQINSLQIANEFHRHASISPNGRLLAVPASNTSLTIYDVESGSALWTTTNHNYLVAWVAPFNALLLAESSGGKSVLLDLQSGVAAPLQAAQQSVAWTLPIKAGKNQQLVGTGNLVSLVGYTRGADGSLASSLVKQWQAGQAGLGSVAPVSMLDGQLLVFISGGDVGWLNLESGQKGTWEMSALGGSGYAKLNEKHLLYFSSGLGNDVYKVLDIQALTLSDATNFAVLSGRKFLLTPRTGFAKQQNDTLVLQATVAAENTQALEPILSAALLERQLRKLQAVEAQTAGVAAGGLAQGAVDARPDAVALAAAQAARAAALAAVGAPNAAKPPNTALIEQLSKQTRSANAQAALRDGLPRDVVEQIRRGETPRIAATNANQIGASVRSGPPAMLADVPANAKLEMVGVYQGANKQTAGSGARAPSPVRVNVSPGTAPVVLALSSYEPITWLIQNSSGRKISAVLLSGYHESSVVGAGSAKTLKIGSSYAYKLGSAEYERWKTEVARYVSNPVATFQGGYEGREFSVGN
jgi:hypothetical protein